MMRIKTQSKFFLQVTSTVVCIFVIAALSAVSASAQPRRVSAQWSSYPALADIKGYRLYHQNNYLCETLAPSATSIQCDIDADDGETWFTLTTLFTDNSESPHSSPFHYTFSTDLEAIISTTKTTGEAPLEITFNGTTSKGGITSYTWDFGDGGTASGSTATHTFLTAGSYTVKLTVSDGEGASDTSDTAITVTPQTSTNQPPSAVISSSHSIGTAPLKVDLDGLKSYDSDGTIISYSWDFGDGTTSSGQQVSHTYTLAGTYNPTLTVTDNDGASNTISTPILVEAPSTANIPPTAIASASTNRGKAPLKIHFDASKSFDPDGTISAYTWFFGDGKKASGKNVSHTFSKTGRYTTTLIVSDNAGENAQTSLKITVDDKNATYRPQAFLTLINSLLLKTEESSD